MVRALELRPGHGQRVGFFAGRAARDPEPHSAGGLGLGDPGEDLLLECLEYLRLSEETRDPDEQILVEVLHFGWVVAKEFQITLEILGTPGGHAPVYPAHDGALFS